MNDPSMAHEPSGNPSLKEDIPSMVGVKIQSETELEIPRPGILSAVVKPLRLEIKSYSFTAGPLISRAAFQTNLHGASSGVPQPSPERPTKRKTSARFKPPGDMIKIKDRLFYLLQPSLQSLIQSSEVQFPFDPFPYQYSGIAFLLPRQAAILADEMGLGKTMQAITTIRLLLRAGMVRSVLLICPKPLVTNWRREFKMWSPEINTVVVEGNAVKRQAVWNARLPVKITNYELVTRDQPLIESCDHEYDLVVLDEAQRIKNISSNTSKVVRSIRRKRSWALTGTPVENSSQDLVGIFEFLKKGYLSSEMPARKIARESRDYILRRTKDQVLDDMPPKLIRDAELELTDEQQTTYEQAESAGVIRLNEIGDALTVQHVFELVLRLKQICNFDPATGSSCKIQRLEADLAEVIASGKKAIVFSQWVETLKKIGARFSHANPLEYHGRVPSRERDGILKQFQDDPTSHLLLMSYGAGSVGLNLQFCRYVFLFDRWWNPAVEDQAINRAHRLGSAGSVTVTRFLTTNTIEERINEVLEAKRELFDMMLEGTDHVRGAKMSKDDVFNLFHLRTPRQGLNKVA